ncbi:MAG: M36 family metallopeptidase, partial [Deltaproteobacteria bacterium]|nr:M36 family metallopeptidase [Deltaproteobacteria bacterium]
MKHVFRLAILGLATSLINCTDAADPAPVDDDETQIDRDDGRPLTPASADAPASIVRSYLRGTVGAAADQLKVIGESTSRGVTHVRLEQVVGGLRVYNSQVKGAVSSRGELLQVIHRLAPATTVIKAQAIESDALRTALIEYGYGIEPARVRTAGNVTQFARTAEMYREPTVERVVYRDGSTLREGFLVETWSHIGNQLDHTLIGGDGKLVMAERRTNNESYNVFVEDPDKSAQTTQPGNGWLSGAQTTQNISGPNAHAYLDTDNNNAADNLAGAVAVTVGNFTATANTEVTPATVDNRAVAVQNLFYLNNVMHDRLEAVGFDNANGNFEGNDPVNAEAQDGGGLDNANFSTPADGSSPRMQMYLWSGNTPAGVVVVNSISYGVVPSAFGPALTDAGVTGPLAVVNDGVGTTSDGCEASAAGSLSGKVAIVDRGTCDFVVKVTNAQNAGAAGVIIANNVDGSASGPGGTSRRITIPSGM